MAATWAYYSFVYEKISLPAAATINTTLTLQVKKVDVHVAGTLALIPVEVRVTSSDASSRTVHLLPTLWTASGQVLMANQAGEYAMWRTIMKDANKGKGRFSHNVTSLQWPQVNLVKKLAWVHPNQSSQGHLRYHLTRMHCGSPASRWGKHPTHVFSYKGKPTQQVSTKAWYAGSSGPGPGPAGTYEGVRRCLPCKS